VPSVTDEVPTAGLTEVHRRRPSPTVSVVSWFSRRSDDLSEPTGAPESGHLCAALALLADPGEHAVVVGPASAALTAAARLLGVRLATAAPDAVAIYDAIDAETRFLVVTDDTVPPAELAAFDLPLLLLVGREGPPEAVPTVRLLGADLEVTGPGAESGRRRLEALQAVLAS
jgi:hypothetical protein